MKRWYYRLSGQFYAYGPTQLMSKKELLAMIRNSWGNGHWPRKTEYWEA